MPAQAGTSRLLIVSPVRNEAAHAERMVKAVAEQELPPAKWIVIDDGSTDGTLERMRTLARDVPFMTVVSAPRALAEAPRDRLAQAPEVRNFNRALDTADWRGYTHVMKLDGDIELPQSYLRELTARFAEDRQLGLAGGVLVEPVAGSMQPIKIPRTHVHGALKCYTRECLESIGGVAERLGWDTIDEVYARMRGFTTWSFPELVAVHHRPFASADGMLRGRARHGECAYIVHYSPWWVVARSLKAARMRPRGLSGAAYLYGYVRAAATGVERVPDPAFRSFTQRELRARARRWPSGWLLRTPVA